MAINSGLSGQVGWIEETTVGTYLAPTDFVEFTSENLVYQRPDLVRAGIRGGRRTEHGYELGPESVTGGITFDLSAETVGSLWKLALGGAASSGADPYEHVFTPGDLATATVQGGRPGTAGTVHPFSYTGCMVSDWNLSCDAGAIATATVNFMGETETTGETLATDTYGQVYWFTFAHGAFTFDDGEYCLDSISIDGNNGLDTRHAICATNGRAPSIRESGLRVYSGTCTGDFEDLTEYNLFRQQAANGAAALSLTFTADATDAILVVAGNVRFTGTTPNVTGPEVLKQELPFVFTSTTSDADAITVTLTNTDNENF